MLDVAPEPYAVTPVLTARVGIAAVGDDPVHAIALRCQVRIEPLRRGYSDDEADGLLDLFGPRERWGTTQHTFLWQHSSAMVPGFTGATQVDLPLECTYDFEVTSAKYLHALRDGTIPLQFLFSGTVFTQGRTRLRGAAGAVGPRGPLRHAGVGVARPDRSSTSRTPAGCGLNRDTSTRSPSYKSARGLPRIDDAITSLLGAGHRAGTSDEHRLGPGPRRRRRGALRGLSALPVPGDVAKEPVPLAVRRARPAGRRGARASARTTRMSTAGAAATRGRRRAVDRGPLPAAAAPRRSNAPPGAARSSRSTS